MAIAFVKTWARDRGYALVIARSKRNKKGFKSKIYMICDRGGKLRTKGPAHRRRVKTSTRKTGCQFGINFTDRGGIWECDFFGRHNHEPSISPYSHPQYRRADTLLESDLIENHLLSGISTAQTLTSIRTDPSKSHLKISMRDLYDRRLELRNEKLNGRLPIQALLMDLPEDFVVFDQRDDENRLTRVAYFYKDSLEFLRDHPEVLVLDATYKVNRFNLPMINITGQTSNNKTFYVGGAFMREDTESFSWLLECILKIYETLRIPYPATLITDADTALLPAVQDVLPHTKHLLCMWHVKKNVQAHVRKHLNAQAIRRNVANTKDWIDEKWEAISRDFNLILNAPTEEEFNTAWANFKTEYNWHHDAVVRYIEDQWIPHKEKIMAAWVNYYPHYGNRATSRVEGFHKEVKKLIPNAVGHLKDVLEKFTIYLARRNLDIRIEIERIRFKRRMDHLMPIFRDCYTTIAPYALDRVLAHIKTINLNPHTVLKCCTGQLKASMGLPCSHIIQERMRAEQSISVDDFNHHWLLGAENLEPLDYRYLLRDPERIVPVGRPRGGSDHSTTRIPSQFEQVEAEIEEGRGRGRGARRARGGRQQGVEQAAEADEEGVEGVGGGQLVDQAEVIQLSTLGAREGEQRVQRGFYANFCLN